MDHAARGGVERRRQPSDGCMPAVVVQVLRKAVADTAG
jgi:hypothetical protein